MGAAEPLAMLSPNDALGKPCSSPVDEWGDEENTEEFDMEAFWDADSRPLRWEWTSPWELEPFPL